MTKEKTSFELCKELAEGLGIKWGILSQQEIAEDYEHEGEVIRFYGVNPDVFLELYFKEDGAFETWQVYENCYD